MKALLSLLVVGTSGFGGCLCQIGASGQQSCLDFLAQVTWGFTADQINQKSTLLSVGFPLHLRMEEYLRELSSFRRQLEAEKYPAKVTSQVIHHTHRRQTRVK